MRSFATSPMLDIFGHVCTWHADRIVDSKWLTRLADCVLQPEDMEWSGSLLGRHVLVKFDKCKYYLGVVVWRCEKAETWHGQSVALP